MASSTVRLWDGDFNLLYSGPSDKPIRWTTSEEQGDTEHYFTGDISLRGLPARSRAEKLLGMPVRYLGGTWSVLAVTHHARPGTLMLGRPVGRNSLWELKNVLWEEVQVLGG